MKVEEEELTDCGEPHDVLALQLVVDQAEVVPGVLQPHPRHGEVEVVLVDVVLRVHLTGGSPAPGELHQGLLPLLAPADPPTPPLQYSRLSLNMSDELERLQYLC